MKLDKKEVILRIKKIHGDKYGGIEDIDYVNNTTKVSLICPVHGVFQITPKSLLNGCGCRLCAQIQNSQKKIN